MLRVTRPGGIVFLSYTVWYGPWGGHETAPWHYLGGAPGPPALRAQARPRAQEQVRRVPVRGDRRAPACAGRDGSERGEVVDLTPRYNPWWSHWLLRVPCVREVVTWNLVIVLRKAVTERRRAGRVHGCASRPRACCWSGSRSSSRPGFLVADTKFDLAVDPGGFLGRAAPPLGRRGRVRPAAEPGLRLPVADGAVLLARAAARPAGLGRAAALAGAGHVRRLRRRGAGWRARSACAPTSRAWSPAFAFALSPRMLTTLGPISIEAWPSALAPVGAAAAGHRLRTRGSPRRAAALSALAVAHGRRRQRRGHVRGDPARRDLAADPHAGPRRRRLMLWWPLFTAARHAVVAGAAVRPGRLQPAVPRLHRDRVASPRSRRRCSTRCAARPTGSPYVDPSCAGRQRPDHAVLPGPEQRRRADARPGRADARAATRTGSSWCSACCSGCCW